MLEGSQFVQAVAMERDEAMRDARAAHDLAASDAAIVAMHRAGDEEPEDEDGATRARDDACTPARLDTRAHEIREDVKRGGADDAHDDVDVEEAAARGPRGGSPRRGGRCPKAAAPPRPPARPAARLHVRTSGLNGDLGRVQYVFTDKTGTLTRNRLRFRYCAIGETLYLPLPPASAAEGEAEAEAEAEAAAAAGGVSATGGPSRSTALARTPGSEATAPQVGCWASMLTPLTPPPLTPPPLTPTPLTPTPLTPETAPPPAGSAAVDPRVLGFCLAAALCNEAIPVPCGASAGAGGSGAGAGGSGASGAGAGTSGSIGSSGGELSYQAASSDDAALVHFARRAGVTLLSRSGSKLTYSYAGREHVAEVLAVLPFTAERRRMSILVRSGADGACTVFTKGADEVVMPLLLGAHLGAKQRRGNSRDELGSQRRSRTPSGGSGELPHTDWPARVRPSEGEMDFAARQLAAFAAGGLRTLVLAQGTLSASAASRWLASYDQVPTLSLTLTLTLTPTLTLSLTDGSPRTTRCRPFRSLTPHPRLP